MAVLFQAQPCRMLVVATEMMRACNTPVKSETSRLMKHNSVARKKRWGRHVLVCNEATAMVSDSQLGKTVRHCGRDLPRLLQLCGEMLSSFAIHAGTGDAPNSATLLVWPFSPIRCGLRSIVPDPTI